MKDQLQEIKKAMQWMWDNMSVKDQSLQSDQFNIPANAIELLDKLIEESPIPSPLSGLVEALEKANPYLARRTYTTQDMKYGVWNNCCAKLRELIEVQSPALSEELIASLGIYKESVKIGNEIANSIFRESDKEFQIQSAPLSGSIEEGECKKCNGSGLVSDPGKPEKHGCAYCNGSGKINTLYDLIATISYGGYLNNRITCKEAEEILSPFIK